MCTECCEKLINIKDAFWGTPDYQKLIKPIIEL